MKYEILHEKHSLVAKHQSSLMIHVLSSISIATVNIASLEFGPNIFEKLLFWSILQQANRLDPIEYTSKTRVKINTKSV